MTIAEKDSSQIQGSTFEHQQSGEEGVKNPFEGITDPVFREFIENEHKHFVALGDGLFDINEALGHASVILCADMEGVPPKKKILHLFRYLTSLTSDGVFPVRRMEPADNGDGILVADRDNLLFAISYLYAIKDRNSKKILNESQKTDRVLNLEGAVELWGDSPVSLKARDYLTALENRRVVNKKKFTNRRGEEDNFQEVKKSETIPPESPEYGKVTARTLNAVLEKARANFSPRFFTSDHYVAASELGLPDNVMKVIEFVTYFDRRKMADFRLDEKKFLLADAERQIKYAIAFMKRIEEHEKKTRGGNQRFREATLQFLYLPRRNIILEGEGPTSSG